jgi:hypothetical protein
MLALGVALASGACSNPITLEGFCAIYSDDYAALAQRCLFGPAPVLHSQAEGRCAQAMAAVDAGRMTYDEHEAKVCLGALEGATCDSPSAWTSPLGPTSCAQTLHGNAGFHARCAADLDCQGTAWCQAPVGTCGGICELPLELGKSCDPSASSAQCGPSATCTGGTCQSLVSQTMGQGQDCTLFGCLPGLACDPTDHRCIPLAAEGGSCLPGHQACEAFTACAANDTCVRYGSANSPCTLLASTTADAAPCLPGFLCMGADGGAPGVCEGLDGGMGCSP